MESDNKELSFEKFFEAYKEQVVPMLREFETERKYLLIKYKILHSIGIAFVLYGICFFLLPIILGLIYIYIPSLSESAGKLASCIFKATLGSSMPVILKEIFIIFSIYIPFFVSIAILMFTKNIPKDFKNKIKHQTKKYILKSIDNIKWHKHNNANPAHHGVFKNSKLDRSGLFLDFNQQFIDDEFEGVYRDVKFKISELTLFDKSEKYSGGVFNGVIISFDFNKKIKNRTVITTKRNFTKKQNFVNILIITALSMLLPIFKYGYSHGKLIFAIIMFLIFTFIIWKIPKYDEEPLDKITLEDPKFNKRFNVYSSDEVEARYLVTPLFMELLNNLKTAFGSKKLKCSFFDDTFMIAISTNKDVFEIGDLSTPCDNPKFILQFWKELSSIYKMIEYFKLDKKIYTNNA